jgi:alpha-1,3-rhamnosyl/mannosyltransferase
MACSHIEPLASIVGSAAVQFDPDDPAQIAASIERIAFDDRLRAELAERGPRQAAPYTWESSARTTLQALTF